MNAVRKVSVRKWSNEANNRFRVQVDYDGKPAPGVDLERITAFEEEVMEWHDASHIHAWFVKNVQNDKDDKGTYPVSRNALHLLLSTCEKVLTGSHLVPEKGYVERFLTYPFKVDAAQKPARVIKNVNVAHKLLPVRGGRWYEAGEYNEAYIKSVEATYDWVARMLADSVKGVGGEIHYSSVW